MSVKYFKVSALVLVLALMTVAGWAQSLRGSLSGTVADPSGAMMPNVSLTLTNIDTGFTATATTGPDGLYSFPNLQAGNYELKATASGFRDFVQRGISILVNQSARLELKLNLAPRRRRSRYWGMPRRWTLRRAPGRKVSPRRQSSNCRSCLEESLARRRALPFSCQESVPGGETTRSIPALMVAWPPVTKPS